MNTLREIWGVRFFHYMTELQRYMKYVFTGHLAIVLVFTIGAGGYTYSEWLKEVPVNFPSAWITAIVLGMAIAFSAPVTLMKPADTVYFLPMETRLEQYLGRAVSWSVASQLPVPIILYIVLLPLLNATEMGSKGKLIGMAIFIVILKWVFVKTETFFRHSLAGEWIWADRILRLLVTILLFYIWLGPYPFLIVIPGSVIGAYCLYWAKAKKKKPFPYEHFIVLEQNRMMRFYRFANYFTDVPHLKGSVSRRGWLGFLMGSPKFEKSKAQTFLVKRTFIRTDDIFWLWARLTALSILGALFIPFPIVVFIFTGALAFASAVQLIYALRAGEEFRMDMLFPEREDYRPTAIRRMVRHVQWIQAVGILIATLVLYGVSLTPFLFTAVILIVSEATIQLTGEKKEEL